MKNIIFLALLFHGCGEAAEVAPYAGHYMYSAADDARSGGYCMESPCDMYVSGGEYTFHARTDDEMAAYIGMMPDAVVVGKAEVGDEQVYIYFNGKKHLPQRRKLLR